MTGRGVRYKMPRVLVLHGPNLNLLGKREPEIYGSITLNDVNQSLERLAAEKGLEIEILQSNHEGELIDAVHRAGGKADFIIINPGAFTHYSYALHDAILAVQIPTLEVHITNIYAREEFRQKSVISPVTLGQIAGLGTDGYLLALEAASRYLERMEEDA